MDQESVRKLGHPCTRYAFFEERLSKGKTDKVIDRLKRGYRIVFWTFFSLAKEGEGGKLAEGEAKKGMTEDLCSFLGGRTWGGEAQKALLRYI